MSSTSRRRPLEAGSHRNELGEEVAITLRTLPPVRLPTGNVIVCDPFTGSRHARALDRELVPGSFEVELTLVSQGGDTRVALATLYLSETQTVRTEWATLTGRRWSFAVDSGMACFCAPGTTECFSEKQEADLIAQCEAHDSPTWSWAELDVGSAGNVVAFSAGFGSGRYSAVWGIDGDGRATYLVAVFDALEGFGLGHLLG